MSSPRPDSEEQPLTMHRYPHVTHMFFNAAIFPCYMDQKLATKAFLTHPVQALTAPNYLIQPVGQLSSDQLGLSWQSNVFGHYLLVRAP